jgi:hypothetical protein
MELIKGATYLNTLFISIGMIKNYSYFLTE